MGYPDNALANDEHIVLYRHPHWRRLLPAVVSLVFSAAMAAFISGFANATMWDSHTKNLIFAVTAVTWLAVVGWLTAWPFLSWLTTHFVITDRRVMFRRGVLIRRGLDIALARITGVELAYGIIDRMMRAGTLIIESATQGPLAFHDIPRVKRVQKLLCYDVLETRGSDESLS